MKNLCEMNFQEYVDYMFEHTTVDGSVLLPVEVNLMGTQVAALFTVRWTRRDAERVKTEFAKYVQNIRDIASAGGEATDSVDEAQKKLANRPDLYVFWRTYIRNFTEKEVQSRIPYARIGAYELISRTAHLCTMMKRGVPEMVVNNEINHLAMYYVMTKYGISTSSTGVRINNLEDLSRPKKKSERVVKSNSRKSLLPLLVADIIRERTNPLRPMTQERLGEILREYPYDLSVNRKALGRVVETIVQEQIGIYKSNKGLYYEK